MPLFVVSFEHLAKPLMNFWHTSHFCRNLPLAWVALGKFLEKFVYLAVEICHQETLPSAIPSFPVGKKICKTEKHQRCRSAWVGQADFRKLELNNRNHSGNCQCLSVKRDQSETRSVWNKQRNFQTFALSLSLSRYPPSFQGFYENSLRASTSHLFGNSLQVSQMQNSAASISEAYNNPPSQMQSLQASTSSSPSSSPETVEGGKRSYDKWSDDEEKCSSAYGLRTSIASTAAKRERHGKTSQHRWIRSLAQSERLKAVKRKWNTFLSGIRYAKIGLASKLVVTLENRPTSTK